jgi:multiple antibiotic resistance protein
MILEILTFTIALLSVVNPLGVIPVWLSLTDGYSKEELFKTRIKVIRNFIIVFLIVLFAGQAILNFFGITLTALRLAGAVMIIISALELLYGSREKRSIKLAKKQNKTDISFSPFTVPMLLGPGTMGLLITYTDSLNYIWSSKESFISYGSLMLSMVFVALLINLIIYGSNFIMKKIGEGGIKAMSKIMGFILLSIGFQHFIISIQTIFNN